MHPFLFEIFGFKMYSYGTVMVAAFLICFFLALKYVPRDVISEQDIIFFCLMTMAGLLIGTKLLEMVIYRDFSVESWLNVLKFWKRGSFSFFPSLLLSIGFIFIYCKLKRMGFLKTMDYLLPFAVLGMAIQRTFGCFLAGCCYGKPTLVPWRIIFDCGSRAGKGFPGTALHPTQLYYGFSAAAIFIFLIWYKRKSVREGEVTMLGLMMLSLSYFFITFFRGDISFDPTILHLSLSQLCSLIVFLVFLLLFFFRSFQKENHIPEEA